MINIVSSSRYKINRPKIKINAEEILIDNNIVDQNLNIVFIGRNKMRQIAKEYKKEDIALPVLSFPYKGEKIEEEKLMGEIFICYPQAVLLAAERNKQVEDIINWLIEHGVDNLIGN